MSAFPHTLITETSFSVRTRHHEGQWQVVVDRIYYCGPTKIGSRPVRVFPVGDINKTLEAAKYLSLGMALQSIEDEDKSRLMDQPFLPASVTPPLGMASVN